MLRSGHMVKYNGILKVFCFATIFFSNGVLAADDLAKTRMSQLRSFQSCNKCDLRGADLRGAILHQSNLRESILIGAHLRWVYFNGVNLRGANLSEVDLRF